MDRMAKKTWIGSFVISGFLAAVVLLAASDGLKAGSAPAPASGSGSAKTQPKGSGSLPAPPQGGIPVAFLLSEGAVVIDFTGPWEVFQDASVPGLQDSPFRLYTVAESTRPIRASGGLQLIPDYTFDNAPAPKVIVIPAQSTRSEAALEWIRKSSRSVDVTMSVCTGAFLLAKTGLLSGKEATTHHTGYGTLTMAYPDIKVRRGARFVDEGNIATAGGLSSGIDLALHVVERYYGREVAVETAYQMEYQGQGWMNPDSNQVYAKRPVAAAGHVLCPVCEMDVDPTAKDALKTVYKDKPYYFCSQAHKDQFEAAPEKVLALAQHP